MNTNRFVSLLFAILVTSLMPILPARADVTTGLVGYWVLKDGPGSFTAADSSGTGNNGTLTAFADATYASMWTTAADPRNGWPYALILNQNTESNNYVSIPDATNLNLSAGREFTVAAWVKLSATGTAGAIISKGQEANKYNYLLDYNGTYFFCKERNEANGGGINLTGTTAPVADTWYHVVATFDSHANPRMVLYVNGVADANSGSSTYTTLFVTSHPVTIGNRQSGTGPYNMPFKGTIAEARVYNRVFSANDVSELYNGVPALASITAQPRSITCYSNDTAKFQVSVNLGILPAAYQWRLNDADIAGATNTNLTLPNVTSANAGTYKLVVSNLLGSVTSSPAVLAVQSLPVVDTSSGLVGWWKFDDASGSSTAADSSVNHNGGALSGFTDTSYATVWGDGILGRALSFNGDLTGLNVVAVPGIGMPAPAVLDFSASPAFTLAGWVNGAPAQTNGAAIIAKGTGNGGEQYVVDIYNGSYRFYVRDATAVVYTIQTTIAPSGFWQHVAAVFNGANGIMNFYVNGALAGTAIAPFSLLANTHEVSIGNRQPDTADYLNSFTGGLDDVRVYSRDLTSADVYALYSVAAFPIITAQYPVTYTNLCTLYGGSSPTFRIATVTGASPFSYQWFTNGARVPDGTNSSLQFLNLPLGASINTYCVVTNALGSATSFVWAATVVAAPTTPHAQSVLSYNPLYYWRLDEPDNNLNDGNPGAVAHEYLGGNDAFYTNTVLGQPGYAQGLAAQFAYTPATDPETSPIFHYLTATDSGAFGIEGVDFSSPAGTSRAFTIAAWVNGGSSQDNNAGIVTKGLGNAEQFNFDLTGTSRNFRFFVRDAAASATHGFTSTNIPDGYWHYLVGVCDQPNGAVYFYIDGALAGQGAITAGTGIRATTEPMSIGARRQSASTTYNYVFNGQINDVVAYGHALSAGQVLSNYLAAGIPPRITQQPPAAATVNEPGLLTLSAAASGTPPLAYQWQDALGSTALLAGQTNATLVISNVSGSLNGDALWLRVTTPYGTVDSSSTLLTVIFGPPRFTLPQRVEVPLGKTYTYSVSPTGTLPFTYQWYDAGSPVLGGTNASYTAAATALGSRTISVTVYNARGSSSASSTLTVVPMPSDAYATSILGMGAVGYWPLQETSAAAPVTMETNFGTLGSLGNAYYAVNNADGIGTVTGTMVFGQEGALIGSGDSDKAVQFAGPSGVNYAFVPRISPALTLASPLSVECWFNSSSGAFSDMLGFGGAPGDGSGTWGGWRLSWNRNSNVQLYWYYGSGSSYYSLSSGAINVGWNHCVVTYDGTEFVMYLNGTEAVRGAATVAPNLSTPFTIGDSRWDSRPTRAYSGNLDEVAVYTNILSTTQITTHFAAASTPGGNYRQTIVNEKPLLYYRMNCAGYTSNPTAFASAVNYGSAPVNGTYLPGIVPGGVSGPSIAAVPGSLAAPINGVISCVNAGNDPAFNPTGAQPFTAMTWFRTYPSDNAVETLMSHGVTNWAMNFDGANGRIVWNLYNATLVGGGHVTSTNVLNDGQWHMAAGVFDGATSSLYIDGALNSSGAVVAGVTGSPNSDLCLGGNADYTDVASGERYFAGALAQAAFFTNALTASQIKNLYEGTAPVPTLSIGRVGTDIIINYTGTLRSSSNVLGPYDPVLGANSPYTVPTTDAQRFYRSSN